MQDAFPFADDLGPAKILQIYDPASGLRASVVVDNVAAGPSIGGVRMAPDVSIEECFHLARAMTLKNAAAGLPHGGGKAVIAADPRGQHKESLIRAFALAIKDIQDYIPGPDMGTDETAMAWIKDEIGRSVGLPPEIGGIPLDQIGATGFGICAAAEIAQDYCDVVLKGARVAVQGFGSVGVHAARFLAARGAVLVAAADSKATILNDKGLDIETLIALKREGRSVGDHSAGETRDRDAVIDVECDIWIPAARPNVIHVDNVKRLNTRLVVQGANIPITPEAEKALFSRGILSIPDFIANAGGVICAAVEYHEGTKTMAFQAIEEKIKANTADVLEQSKRHQLTPRHAAVALAEERVRRAMGYRREA